VLLFVTQLGGGTDINRAIAYCETLVARPRDTILVLVSDLFEGGDDRQLLARIAALVDAGVTVIALLALSDDHIRADLSVVRTPLPSILLETRGLAAAAAGLLRWIWSATIEPDWPRRLRVLQADIVSRTSRLSEQGWSGVLRGLGPDVRWLGEGRIQVNRWGYPPTDVRGRDLMFIAAHTQRVNVSWRLPDRFALAYPVTGIFAPTATPDEPLVQLLGRNRARILVEAASPVSTTLLVATTGLSLATISDHLRVLTDSGLLERRRSGRSVLYWQSDTGRRVVGRPASG